MSPPFHIYLVSDATGDTVEKVARACLVQFENVEVTEHHWYDVRTRTGLADVIDAIEKQPGLVLYTMVDSELREELRAACHRARVRSVSIMQPIMRSLSAYFGVGSRNEPGRQHLMDDSYFQRIDAMDFVLAHDDGQSSWALANADIVLVGLSRTSKTPTSVYLGQRGYKTANVPFVPPMPLPPELLELTRPLVVGLVASPERLISVRRNRLKSLGQDENSPYVDSTAVNEEVRTARRLFTEKQWPVIDVTRRSIEETAASIIRLYDAHVERRNGRESRATDSPPTRF